MNSKAINFIKDFSYTLSSNLVSFIVSTLVILIIPKLIGVEEYGYWQLYLFYSSYVGILQFGWNDGIYLRYGGKEYKKLDKELFFSQFYMQVTFQLILAVILYSISILLFKDLNKTFIFKMIALNLFIVNVRSMMLFILQGTNRIKEYAHITLTDRIVYCSLIIIFLIFGIREFKIMIVADLIGKFASLSYVMYSCKDIVFRKFSTFCCNFKETADNINVGIKLMFANIADTLIIGVIRFGIEYKWNVSTFGKVSLTLSVSNLMMLFINALGIIMFPILRRIDETKLTKIYITMRDFLMIIFLGILLLFYPLKIVLSAWLPKYAVSLMYMALVFPMSVYEGKMAILINTYLKTMRKEKVMLRINLISLGLSVIITFMTCIVFKNLNLSIASIAIILIFRCVFAEVYLSRILKIYVFKDIILELIMTFIFIFTGWFINSWFAIIIYLIAYMIYLVIKRKDITSSIKNVQFLIKD